MLREELEPLDDSSHGGSYHVGDFGLESILEK